MPTIPKIASLAKSDRRAQWSALKSKHKQAIAAKKLNFDAKLGPALDKYQLQVKTVNKLFVAEKVSLPAIQKLLTTTRPLLPLTDHYLDKVKGLGNPAEKELTTFLATLRADCLGWEQVLDMFEQKAVPVVNSAQLNAVRALYENLDALTAQLDNLRRSLPDAATDLKSAPKTWEIPSTYKGSLDAKAWRALVGVKAKAALEGTASLAASRAAAAQDINPLLTAVKNFTAYSDYHTFKQRAQAVAAGSLPAFAQQAAAFHGLSTDPEYDTQLGYKRGQPSLNFRRAGISAGQASTHAADLIQELGRLP